MSLFRIIKKFKSLLSRHQKVRVIEMTILMIIGGLLEACSVSLVLPFMDAAMNSASVMEKGYVRWICRMLEIDTSRGFLMMLAVVLAAIYILKNIYLLFEYNVQYRFVYGNMFEMQKRLLNHFIHRPYEYFLKINSGEIIRIVNVDTSLTFELLSTILAFFSETVVSVMLIATVFILSPLITTVMAMLLLLLLLTINQMLKPILTKAGVENQASAAGMNKWLLQSIQGIKELKVMARESFFLEKYNGYGQQYVRTLRKSQILGIVPRFFIEALCMSAMFLILAVLLYRGAALTEIVPIVSAVAMAAVRLMPSVNRMSKALANISYGEPMLDKLIESMQDISGRTGISLTMDLKHEADCHEKEDSLTYEADLNFHEITYRYPGAEKDVLHKASMSVVAGESAGIIGASGAGKTTAVDIILGLLKPEKGQVLVDGREIMSNMKDWRSKVGYIPQMIFMLDDTVRANVTFGMPESEFTDDDVWNALEEASLAEFVKGLPKGLDTEIGERGVRLSGGQRQRIGIARALFRNTDVLIFDEATSALDNNTESAIMESINRLHGKKTIIIIAHRLTTIETCNHIFKIENGKIWKER